MEPAQWIEDVTGRAVVGPPLLVQELWSGYGAIERWLLEGDPAHTVILKRVRPPSLSQGHPRGWNSERSDARKRRSYLVERSFYRDHAALLGERARMPSLLGEQDLEQGCMMLLEDLDAAGFPERRHDVSDVEIKACLDWLAAFHGTFLGRGTEGLWERGTYWHLGTRPDELEAMEPSALRAAAALIDSRISSASFRTLVHGDAKLANFCFPRDATRGVAAVDMQYVGGGVGVQDVSYFLGSCLDDCELTRLADGYLDHYFASLRGQLGPRADDGDSIEAEWRSLWPYAWADFQRFLVGWAPGHWKLSKYSERMTSAVL